MHLPPIAPLLAVCLTALWTSGPAQAEPAAPGPPSAQQIVDRIKDKVACARRGDTVDTFKAGDPSRPVTGIVTTFAATFDVLTRAAAAGKNLVIAHEPTFYEHREDTRPIEGDPVLEAKRALLKKEGIMVWRFHDLVHCRRPDGIHEGMIQAMGWLKHQRPGTPPTFTLPATTVRALARDLRHKLKARAVRVVGNLEAKVTKIGFMPGAADAANQIRLLASPEVEVLVTGESREWETVEYVRDAVAQGRRKALILLGHVPSEERGMETTAAWLRTFIPEVPTVFMPAGDPFQTLE